MDSKPQAPCCHRVCAVALVLRCLTGGWFLFSGGFKWFGSGIDRFVRDIANYRMLAEPWDVVAAYAVISLEVAAGLCLLLGVLRRGAILVTAALVAVFSFSIAWAWVHQLDISCGCHGGDGTIRYWRKIGEFLLYISVLAFLWRVEARSSDHHSKGAADSECDRDRIPAEPHREPCCRDHEGGSGLE